MKQFCMDVSLGSEPKDQSLHLPPKTLHGPMKSYLSLPTLQLIARHFQSQASYYSLSSSSSTVNIIFSLHALSRKPRVFTGFFALIPAVLLLEMLLSLVLSYFVFDDCTSLSLAIVQCLLCRTTGSLILDHPTP